MAKKPAAERRRDVEARVKDIDARNELACEAVYELEILLRMLHDFESQDLYEHVVMKRGVLPRCEALRGAISAVLHDPVEGPGIEKTAELRRVVYPML